MIIINRVCLIRASKLTRQVLDIWKNKGVYQYPILRILKVGIRVSSTGFHSNRSDAVRFVDIIPVPGAKNV